MSDNTPKPPAADPSSAAPAANDRPDHADDEQDQANAAALPSLADCQAELAIWQAKNAELADQYLRAKADLENTRRRAEDEIAKARKFALESFADSLLPVIDSLEAGLAIQDARVEQIQEGVQATLRQLLAALERNKVLPINPEPGSKFDPHQHQAISVVASQYEANSVVSVLQKGYSISDRILRAALVTVSAAK